MWNWISWHMKLHSCLWPTHLQTCWGFPMHMTYHTRVSSLFLSLFLFIKRPSTMSRNAIRCTQQTQIWLTGCTSKKRNLIDNMIEMYIENQFVKNMINPISVQRWTLWFGDWYIFMNSLSLSFLSFFYDNIWWYNISTRLLTMGLPSTVSYLF